MAIKIKPRSKRGFLWYYFTSTESDSRRKASQEESCADRSVLVLSFIDEDHSTKATGIRVPAVESVMPPCSVPMLRLCTSG